MHAYSGSDHNSTFVLVSILDAAATVLGDLPIVNRSLPTSIEVEVEARERPHLKRLARIRPITFRPRIEPLGEPIRGVVVVGILVRCERRGEECGGVWSDEDWRFLHYARKA